MGYVAVNGLAGKVFLTRLHVFVLLEWFYMAIYHFSAAFINEQEFRNRTKKFKKSIIISSGLFSILNIVFSIFLPIEYVPLEGGSAFMLSGLLYWYLLAWVLCLIICSLFYMFQYKKKLDTLSIVLYILTLSSIICNYICSFFIYAFDCEPLVQIMMLLFLYLTVESQDKALFEEFNESSLKAKETNELKSEFIMNMSHQLRTPLNTILGFSESLMMSDNLTQEEFNEDMSSVEAASRSLLNLINSILDVSKLDANKEIIKNDNYTLDSVIYEISSNINSEINRDNIVFIINVDENCPNDLIGDGYKLSKVLNIYLSNIIKNITNGEVSFNVTSNMIDTANSEIVFTIKNNGKLVNKQSYVQSFDDLNQLNSNSNNIDTEYLNMIVAGGLLNIIGGSIEFVNSDGISNQCIIKINQKVTSSNKIGNIREKIQTNHEYAYQIINLLGKKILIVDDKEINSGLLKQLLVQYNATIDVTAIPMDGVGKILSDNYDIVFVCDDMDDMSGEDFVGKLVSSGNKIPPVVGIVSDVIASKEYKYDYIIDSSVEFKRLNKVIKNIFE